ncbi:TetR/AcrR family transcriptional regulator [Saccharothrix sp. Mg75]|uniref:TetR/AcrR family transcriptional regulator n=1 Tax=Saccharothrix sp. Mg75 TaxID=3445357 RepID=UPI003EEF4579
MTKAPAARDDSPGQGGPVSRPRNRRGEGLRLREDIVRAATALIVRAGTDQALTLRSVAREVGISTPSIYAHFSDREAIVEAVVLEAIAQLHGDVKAAVTAHGDPVEGLLAGCAAYVDFGTREPARYRVLFDRPHLKPENARAEDPGLAAFHVLVDNLEACVRSGRSTSTDPFGDAVALWTALHGRVLLRASLPDFPWPPSDTLERTVFSLGRITPSP